MAATRRAGACPPASTSRAWHRTRSSKRGASCWCGDWSGQRGPRFKYTSHRTSARRSGAPHALHPLETSMPENRPGGPQDAPPHAQLIQMATGHVPARLLYVAARLGLADHLSDGPKTAAALAEKTGMHAPSLGRVMRTLAMLGVFTEDAQH